MDPLMTIWVFLIGIIIGVIAGVMLAFRTAVSPLHQRINKLTCEPEQYQALMNNYPYNRSSFRFIGDPVDGIQFEEDKILFVRFKTGKTPRTPEQNHLKNLVATGQVGWFEFTTK